MARSRDDTFQCKCCGYRFPKKDALASGGKGYAYGYHVHCPRCTKVVVEFLTDRELSHMNMRRYNVE